MGGVRRLPHEHVVIRSVRLCAVPVRIIRPGQQRRLLCCTSRLWQICGLGIPALERARIHRLGGLDVPEVAARDGSTPRHYRGCRGLGLARAHSCREGAGGKAERSFSGRAIGRLFGRLNSTSGQNTVIAISLSTPKCYSMLDKSAYVILGQGGKTPEMVKPGGSLRRLMFGGPL